MVFEPSHRYIPIESTRDPIPLSKLKIYTHIAGNIIYHYWVGGLEHELYDFPYVGNFIFPTDELIFFRGVGLNHQLD